MIAASKGDNLNSQGEYMAETRFDWTGALKTLSQVRRKKVEWLKVGGMELLPHKQVSLIDGMPQGGKSWVCMEVMAQLARQGKHTLYICNEDSDEYVTEPRMVQVLQLEREYHDFVHLYRNTIKHKVVLGRGHAEAAAVVDLIRQTDAYHVFVNPVQSFLPGKTDTNKLEQISPLIDICSEIAQNEGCGITLIRHFAKTKGDGKNAIEKGHGSIGFIGSARVALAVVPHPDYVSTSGPDFHKVGAVVQIKNNLGPQMPSVTFELRPDYFGWLPDAREVMPEELGDQMTDPINAPDRDEVKDCYETLVDMFRVRETYEPDVIEMAAKRIGYSMSSMRRAATQLGIVKKRDVDDSGVIRRHWWVRPKMWTKGGVTSSPDAQ